MRDAHRRGSLALDIAVAMPLILAVIALGVHDVHCARHMRRSAERAAALERAQNIAARWRAGLELALPEGWRGELQRTAGAQDLLLHLPDGRVLRSLRSATP